MRTTSGGEAVAAAGNQPQISLGPAAHAGSRNSIAAVFTAGLLRCRRPPTCTPDTSLKFDEPQFPSPFAPPHASTAPGCALCTRMLSAPRRFRGECAGAAAVLAADSRPRPHGNDSALRILRPFTALSPRTPSFLTRSHTTLHFCESDCFMVVGCEGIGQPASGNVTSCPPLRINNPRFA